MSTVTAQTPNEESSSGDETQLNPGSNNNADVEIKAGDASLVENSWVNLHKKDD